MGAIGFPPRQFHPCFPTVITPDGHGSTLRSQARPPSRRSVSVWKLLDIPSWFPLYVKLYMWWPEGVQALPGAFLSEPQRDPGNQILFLLYVRKQTNPGIIKVEWLGDSPSWGLSPRQGDHSSKTEAASVPEVSSSTLRFFCGIFILIAQFSVLESLLFILLCSWLKYSICSMVSFKISHLFPISQIQAIISCLDGCTLLMGLLISLI